MQRRHRAARPIATVGSWLRQALKQLALFGGRQRKPA
jgi:hypothetical protein